MRLRLTATVLLLCAACAAPQTHESAVNEVSSAWMAQVARGTVPNSTDSWPRTGGRLTSSSSPMTLKRAGWLATLERYRARYQGEGKQMGALDFPQLDVHRAWARKRCWHAGVGA